MKVYEFDAVIQKVEGIDAAYIVFPYDVEKEFGAKGQVKVKATFDGYGYRGSLAKMGHPCHIIGLTKEVRKAIAKNPGDRIHVVIVKDEEPRVVDIPEDLSALFQANSLAKEVFDGLSYTKQKEIVQGINGAKKPETRAKRLQEAIRRLTEG